MLIKNQNKNNGKLCDTKKKLEQGSIINETKIIKVKVNVLLINSIKKNIKLLDNYIDYVIKNNNHYNSNDHSDNDNTDNNHNKS